MKSEEKKVRGLITPTGKIELAEDALVDNEEFKKNVAIPYFKDIFKDLQSQSDDKTKGINRVTLLNVFKSSLTSLVHSAARHNWRKVPKGDESEWQWVYRPKGIRAWHVQSLL
jgi:hypothetical protein